jgi:hypothetical protein
MTHNKQKLFEKAKQVAQSKKLIFIEEVVSFLPISKDAFYRYYPVDSDEYDEIRRIIDDNKVAIKSTMRKKWYDSDNPTLQLALYRLTSTQEEHKKLNQSYIDQTTKGDKIQNEPIQVQVVTTQDEAESD